MKKDEVQLIHEESDTSIGSYSKNHNVDQCDKCGKEVGRKMLIQLPFIYHDYNDHIHPDVRPPYMYHQYYVCIECWERGV